MTPAEAAEALALYLVGMDWVKSVEAVQYYDGGPYVLLVTCWRVDNRAWLGLGSDWCGYAVRLSMRP